METIETLKPIKYDVNLAQIGKLKEEFMPLVITDLEDQEQFDVVHKARMIMVKVRTTIDKERKIQKASALEYGRQVDAAAKELFEASEPIETHLQAEEDKVINEQKRIKEEKEREFQLAVNAKVEALMKYNIVLPFADIAGMDDSEFDELYAAAREDFEAKQRQLVEAEEKRIAELAEIARRAEEQAKKDKELADKEKALRMEVERLRAERQELEDKKRKEKDRKNLARLAEETKKKAIEDAQDEIDRKDKEAKEKAESDKIEKLRQENLRPDREKLLAWAETIASLVVPDVRDEKAKAIVEAYECNLGQIADQIKTDAGRL